MNVVLRVVVTIGTTFAAASALSAQAAVATTPALPAALVRDAEARIASVTPKVVAWRRDIHANPELGFAETRTAALVAAHLRALGLEVRAGVGGTGVIGVLRGGRPGPTVALRADMDALPVTEQTGLPFASRVRTTYNGQDVGVMHACGHDTHVAVLMGVAEVLTGMKATLAGSVTFLFQPAEEGPFPGGAVKLIEAGAMDTPRVDAVYGLHSWPGPVGTISTRSGGMMASTDNWKVIFKGRQTHGAQPWSGVDPIVVGAQFVSALQTIVSRSADLTSGPAVVTTGLFNAGVRENIIPDSAVLSGTFRTHTAATRVLVRERIRALAANIAAAHGATAIVSLTEGYPTTVNTPAWFGRASTVLRRALGEANVQESRPAMPAEDFSRYLERAPGLFLFLGGTPVGKDPMTVAANHSPLYDVDEAALPVGVRALTHLALDAMTHGLPARVTP
jgi:amidohydrolase